VSDAAISLRGLANMIYRITVDLAREITNLPISWGEHEF